MSVTLSLCQQCRNYYSNYLQTGIIMFVLSAQLKTEARESTIDRRPTRSKYKLNISLLHMSEVPM